MTKEQLDAIRARVEAAKTEEGWEPVHQIHKESYVDETHTGFQACGPIVFCGKYGDRSADEANELSYAHMDLIENAPADLLALLAEVERLTAEVEAKTTQSVALMGMNGRLQQEVERLTAVCARYRDELSSSHDDFDEAHKQVNELSDKVERLTAKRDDAYRRGVAAMREAARMSFVAEAEKWQREGDGEMELRYLRLAGDIRALPDPEDTP